MSIVLKHKTQHKNSSKQIRQHWINAIIYPVAVLQPLMTLPQIIKIFGNQTAAGVSLLTWSSYTIASFIWLYYGIVHKERVIIVTQILWSVMQVIVMVGIIIYS